MRLIRLPGLRTLSVFPCSGPRYSDEIKVFSIIYSPELWDERT